VDKKRILFIWTGLTSYMGDCWRRLAAEPGVELKIVVAVRKQDGTAFTAANVLHDLDYAIVDAEKDFDPASIGFAPDIVFAVGWHAKPCRAVVEYAPWSAIPKVCCFDLPWRWKLRCLAAPFVLGRFLRGYAAAFVPGEYCARYAKWLGFKKTYCGLFAIDTGRFGNGVKGVGSYFLYIGRNSPEKRLGDLRRAYALYRERGGTLPLRLYGKDLADGFLAPEQVPDAMHRAAAFVLASDFDPWPLVLLEAMSAGCPVIASNKCTNFPELGKNWRRFRCGDTGALAKAMADAEAHPQSAAAARENLELAQRYDCGRWVARVKETISDLEAL